MWESSLRMNISDHSFDLHCSGGILEFYRISYMWYSLIGFSVTIFVGLIVSFLTGKQDPRTLDPQLISPAIDKLVRAVVPESIRETILWDLGVHKVSHEVSHVTFHYAYLGQPQSKVLIYLFRYILEIIHSAQQPFYWPSTTKSTEEASKRSG